MQLIVPCSTPFNPLPAATPALYQPLVFATLLPYFLRTPICPHVTIYRERLVGFFTFPFLAFPRRAGSICFRPFLTSLRCAAAGGLVLLWASAFPPGSWVVPGRRGKYFWAAYGRPADKEKGPVPCGSSSRQTRVLFMGFRNSRLWGRTAADPLRPGLFYPAAESRALWASMARWMRCSSSGSVSLAAASVRAAAGWCASSFSASCSVRRARAQKQALNPLCQGKRACCRGRRVFWIFEVSGRWSVLF